MVGKIGSTGLGVAEKIIDKIPSEEARGKLKGVIDKGREVVNKADNSARNVANKVAPWAKFGLDVIKTFKPAISNNPVVASLPNPTLNPMGRMRGYI